MKDSDDYWFLIIVITADDEQNTRTIRATQSVVVKTDGIIKLSRRVQQLLLHDRDIVRRYSRALYLVSVPVTGYDGRCPAVFARLIAFGPTKWPWCADEPENRPVVSGLK